MKMTTLREQKRYGILLISVGLALVVLGIVLASREAAMADFYSGLGCAIAACGVVRLLRCHRLGKNPERAADYEALCKDERTAYIAGKARSITFFVCLYVQLAAGLIALLAFDQALVGKTLCLATSAQALVYCGVYRWLNKKY